MADVCCFICYTLSSVQSLPAIVRIIKQKRSTDISLTSVCLCYIASLAWTAYIFLTSQSTLVYVGTVWDIIVVTVYSVVVFVYHENNPFKKKTM